MKSVLCDEFRCLHHVIHIYARHVQDFVAEAQQNSHTTTTTTAATDSNTKKNYALVTAAGEDGAERKAAPPLSPAAVSTVGGEDPLLGLCSYYFELECLRCAIAADSARKLQQQPQEKADTLRCTPERVLYRSEVCSGTQHPTWAPLPATLREKHGEHTALLLRLYQVVRRNTSTEDPAQEEAPSPRPPPQETPERCDAVLLGSIALSLPTLLYLGDCVTNAEAQLAQLQQQRQQREAKGAAVVPGDNSSSNNNNNNNSFSSCFALLLRCVDGVFAAPSLFFATPAADSGSPPPRSTATWYTAGRPTQGVGLTVGDLQTWALTSRAWAHYRACLSAQQATQQLTGEAAAVTERAAARPALQRALREAQQAEARAALAAEEAEVAQLRQQVAQARAARDEQQALLHAARQAAAATTTETTDKHQRTQEQRLLGTVESAAWAERRRLVRELSLLFPVELAEDGSYNNAACRTARRAKDSIRGALLPVGTVGTRAGGDSPWAATTADEMAEEAAALGYAAEVIAALAVVHDCALPYPLVFAGPRSRVLAAPALSPAQAAAAVTGPTDVKLPLYCLRAAERPTMLAAVRLLLLDAAAVAQEMGKRPAVMACGQRLGAVLHVLLAGGHC